MAPRRKAGKAGKGPPKKKARTATDLDADSVKGLPLATAKGYFDRAYKLKIKKERPNWDEEDIRDTLFWLRKHGDIDMGPFDAAVVARAGTLPAATYVLPDEPRTADNRDTPPTEPEASLDGQAEAASMPRSSAASRERIRPMEGSSSGRASRPTVYPSPSQRTRSSPVKGSASRRTSRPIVGPDPSPSPPRGARPGRGSPPQSPPSSPSGIAPGPGQHWEYPYPWWPDHEWPNLDDSDNDNDDGVFNPLYRYEEGERSEGLVAGPLLFPFEDGDPRAQGWRGVKTLGEGGYGIVALWVRVDANMNILERMAVKECYYWSSLAWRDPREWRDKLPREIAYMNRLKATGCTEHIINHKGHRLIMHQQRLRIYLDFCDYGSLLSVLRRFPLENGKANQSKEKEGKSLATWKKKVTVEKELPEAWIWHCFYAMVDACLVMRDGTRGAKQGDWREIIHCDFKPENVLITPPRAEEGTTKTGKEKVKAVQEGSEMPLVQRPNWPKVAVTDFGCAFDDGPDNPREYIEDGTFHMRPPEHRLEYWKKKQYRKKRMTSKANVWGVGATIWQLITNAYIHGPIDESDGIPEDIDNEEDSIRWLDHSDHQIGETVHNLSEEDYATADILLDGGFPMAERYPEELRELVRKCLRFRAEDRPTLEELVAAIVPHLPPDDDPPDLLFGEQTFRPGTRWVPYKSKTPEDVKKARKKRAPKRAKR